MSRYIRKVKTASGATAVQIITKRGRERTGLEHIGSAHTQKELEILLAHAREKLHEGQASLFDERNPNLVAKTAHTRYLFDILSSVYDLLGFDIVSDTAFRQLVCARIIEPSSKLDTVRILEGLGLDAPSSSSLHRALKHCVENDYRSKISKACLKHVDLTYYSLVLYDVTTLYFEVQKEDDYRKPGLSKERKLDPQITVGLLVDSSGFPLEIASFEGNKAEVHTMIPVLEAFKAAHSLKDIVVVADAAMLSSKSLTSLEELGYHYVVASRISKCPYEIEEYRNELRHECFDKQIFDLEQTFNINSRRVKRRVIYQYREKRAKLDLSNIEKSLAKAQSMVAGKMPVKRNRFVSVSGARRSINESLVESAKQKAGIKGYVTNLDTDPQIIINAYHQLFEVERSFRMSKSDLRARPIFHRKRDSIEAHLTIVFTALAISRYIQERTGISIKKFVQKLSTVCDVVISVNGAEIPIPGEVSAEIAEIVSKLSD